MSEKIEPYQIYVVKVGAPLVEFAEGPEADTGTVVGKLRQDEKRETLQTPREAARAQSLQTLPAVRALASPSNRGGALICKRRRQNPSVRQPSRSVAPE